MRGKSQKNARGKGVETRIRKHKQPHNKPPYLTVTETPDVLFIPRETVVQHFHIDFGLICESLYVRKYEGYTLISIDAYNAYLLIIDRASRYT